MADPLENLTKGAVVIVGSAALGWIAGMLVPIFFKNATGQFYNDTLASLANNSVIPLVLAAVGLFTGIIIVMRAAGKHN